MLEEEKVKCKDCGFLGIHRRSDRLLCEVEQAIRETGVIPEGPTNIGKQKLFDDHPICFHGEFDLPAECTAWVGKKNKNFACLESERECEKFKPWRRGLSPKELNAEILNEEARASEHAWRERQAEKDRLYRLEDQAEARAWRKQDVWLVRLNFSMSALAIIAAIIIGLIEANWIEMPDWLRSPVDASESM